MKQIFVNQNELFGPWMMEKLGRKWYPGQGQTIGLWEDDRPVAAVSYENSNKASIMLHCVGLERKWLNREFLWFVFYYPFEQLGITKIICPVEGGNAASRTFIEHIGFTLEATLKDAAPKGDLLIYTMVKDQCKWLSLKERYRGETRN